MYEHPSLQRNLEAKAVPVPDIGLKEERRMLGHASDG